MKKTLGEIITHPLWIMPVFLLGIFVFIEGLHTAAHMHGEMDVHGICRQNQEYIEMKEESEDW